MPFLLDVRRFGQRVVACTYVACDFFASLRREFGDKKKERFWNNETKQRLSLSSCGSFSNFKTRRFFSEFRNPAVFSVAYLLVVRTLGVVASMAGVSLSESGELNTTFFRVRTRIPGTWYYTWQCGKQRLIPNFQFSNLPPPPGHKLVRVQQQYGPGWYNHKAVFDIESVHQCLLTSTRNS